MLQFDFRGYFLVLDRLKGLNNSVALFQLRVRHQLRAQLQFHCLPPLNNELNTVNLKLRYTIMHENYKFELTSDFRRLLTDNVESGKVNTGAKRVVAI